MLNSFLLYNKVNQLYIYIYPHIPSLLSPSLPSSLSHGSRWTQSTELISLCYAAASHQLSILHLVVYICPWHSLTSPQLTLPPPCVLKSVLLSASLLKCFLKEHCLHGMLHINVTLEATSDRLFGEVPKISLQHASQTSRFFNLEIKFWEKCSPDGRAGRS